MRPSKYTVLWVEGLDLLDFRVIVRNRYVHLHDDVDKNMKV